MLEIALANLVYEITHLSPKNADGSHNCRISAEALQIARAALQAEEVSAPSTVLSSTTARK